MATARLSETKDGRRFYRIEAYHGTSRYSMRWYVPDGWGQKAIDRELNRIKADFDRRAKAGEIKNRKQQKEAERLEAEAAAKIETLRQYGNAVFMPALSVTCSENTRANYQGILDSRIYPALGDFKLPNITPAQINAFLLDQQKQGLSLATCVKLYQILNQLFKKAYWEDAVPKNPMDKVSRPKATKGQEASPDAFAFTAEEIAFIVSCLDKEPLKWRVLIHLCIQTGARRGEITGLKWEDINPEAGSIQIKRTLCYTPEKGIYTNSPKNGKARTVYPPAYLFSMLADLKREQVKANSVLVLHSQLSGFVFQRDGTDEPMHPDTPTRYFHRFGKRYGIKDFHPHKLRHSFASIAITQGADIASVSETLGHSDKALTLRMYTHADEESRRKASRIFSDTITEASQKGVKKA